MRFRQNVAIIYSLNSRQEYILQGQKDKSIYTFSGSNGKINWLKGQYAYLSVNGLSTILRRLGIKHDIINDDSIALEDLKCYDFIFVPDACNLAKNLIDVLLIWIKDGGGLFISGKSNLPLSFLGLAESKTYKPENYIGIKWKECKKNLLENLPVSPPGYEIVRVKAMLKSKVLGSLIEYGNFRNKSSKELQLNADALIKNDKVTYLTIPIFEFMGGLLQGHIDIESLRALLGTESNFYLDKICMLTKGILEEIGFYSLCYARLRPWGSYDNVFILRHDTDLSSDDTYYKYEVDNNLSATYAVLLDKNRKIWKSRISRVPFLECAYHFKTNKEVRFKNPLKRLKIVKDKPDKNAITRRGLLKQVLGAERKLGLKFKTLHRHYGFFLYPETIEAMKSLYDGYPSISGMGTMFRFTNVRYASSKEAQEYTVTHPNVSVPFWFPFKIAISTIEYFEILRGWDTASLIEPDFAMTDLVFKNSSLLSNGVYTFGFHPVHARSKTFNKDGNYKWFMYSIEIAMKNNWWMANCEMVYHKLNDWEDIVFRWDNSTVTLYNPTDRDIKDIFLETDIEVKGIDIISDRKIEISHPRLLGISLLKRNEEIRFKIIT